jgi:Uma2 family endonuclease
MPDLGDYIQIDWHSRIVGVSGRAEGLVVRVVDTDSECWIDISPSPVIPEADPCPDAVRFRRGRLPDAEKAVQREDLVPA